MPKPQTCNLEIQNSYHRILESEQRLHWLISLPFMSVLFYLYPWLALRLIRHHLSETVATITSMTNSMTASSNNHEKMLDTVLKSCFQDFHFTLLRDLSQNCLGSNAYRQELKDFYKLVLRELSDLKETFDKTHIRTNAKDSLKNILKYKASTIYNKLFLLYLGEADLELAIHAATKALEGFQSMPDDVPCTLLPFLKDIHANKRNQKDLVIRNQTYTLYFAFFIDKVRNKDQEGALFYFDKLLNHQSYVSPSLDRVFPSFYQDFVKTNNHFAILQFAKRFQKHYHFKPLHPKLNKEPEPGFFQKKSTAYQALYEKHKQCYLEQIANTFLTTQFLSQIKLEDLNGNLAISHPSIEMNNTIIKCSEHHLLKFNLTAQTNKWIILNWQEFPLEVIMGYLHHLDEKLSSLEAAASNQPYSASSNAFDFESMRNALPADILPPLRKRNAKKAAKPRPEIDTSRKKVPQQSPTTPPPRTAADLGIDSLPGDTLLYPIHGEHVAPDNYYIYAKDLEGQIDHGLLDRYLKLLASGILVGPKENGIRFVGENERKRRHLPKDVIMKIAIKRKDERIAVQNVGSFTKDGKTRTLCCASLVFRH